MVNTLPVQIPRHAMHQAVQVDISSSVLVDNIQEGQLLERIEIKNFCSYINFLKIFT